MPGASEWLLALTLPVLLVVSAFFSGSETALFSLTRHQRIQLGRQKTVAARALLKLLDETRGLLITLLLGNMVINVLYFVISTVLLRNVDPSVLHPLAVAALALVPLIAVILLGEVLPKLVAAHVTMRWARWCAVPLLLVHRGVAPVRLFASWFVITPLARLIAPAQAAPELSPEELEAMLRLSQRQGVIDPGEEELLQQVLELSRLKVRDLMIPRVDIVAFDLTRDPAELIALVKDRRLRHVPVFGGDEGGLDDVRGVVYARQVLLRRPDSREALERLIRQVKFVPELQRADRLLVDLRKTGTTFAMVVDEYGGTAGLVTMEDVVEHLLGNIPGAFEDEGEPEVEQVEPRVWRVSAGLSVHDWAEAFSPAARAGRGPRDVLHGVSTVGGLVMARLGRAAEVGDRVRLGNVEMEVERVTGRRVETVLIRVLGAVPLAG